VSEICKDSLIKFANFFLFKMEIKGLELCFAGSQLHGRHEVVLLPPPPFFFKSSSIPSHVRGRMLRHFAPHAVKTTANFIYQVR